MRESKQQGLVRGRGWVHTAAWRENCRKGGSDCRQWARDPRGGSSHPDGGPGYPEGGCPYTQMVDQGPPGGGVLTPRQWVRGPPKGVSSHPDGGSGDPQGVPRIQMVDQGTPKGAPHTQTVGQGTPKGAPHTQTVGHGTHLCDGLDSKGPPCSQVSCALGRAGCGEGYSVGTLSLGVMRGSW